MTAEVLAKADLRALVACGGVGLRPCHPLPLKAAGVIRKSRSQPRVKIEPFTGHSRVPIWVDQHELYGEKPSAGVDHPQAASSLSAR